MTVTPDCWPGLFHTPRPSTSNADGSSGIPPAKGNNRQTCPPRSDDRSEWQWLNKYATILQYAQSIICCSIVTLLTKWHFWLNRKLVSVSFWPFVSTATVFTPENPGPFFKSFVDIVYMIPKWPYRDKPFTAKLPHITACRWHQWRRPACWESYLASPDSSSPEIKWDCRLRV